MTDSGNRDAVSCLSDPDYSRVPSSDRATVHASPESVYDRDGPRCRQRVEPENVRCPRYQREAGLALVSERTSPRPELILSPVGLIVWVQKKDAMGNVRQIGHFTDPGLNMMPYPYGCGGSMNQTIVHKTALDDGAADPNQSAPITWQMGCDQIAAGEKAQVAGICVTEAMDDMPGGGFGRFAVDLPV